MAIEHEYTRVIHHGGRTFFATATMCDIFVAHADDIRGRGDTELVPLLHRGGVVMLLVGQGIPYAVTAIEVGAVPPPSPDGMHHDGAPQRHGHGRAVG